MHESPTETVYVHWSHWRLQEISCKANHLFSLSVQSRDHGDKLLQFFPCSGHLGCESPSLKGTAAYY